MKVLSSRAISIGFAMVAVATALIVICASAVARADSGQDPVEQGRIVSLRIEAPPELSRAADRLSAWEDQRLRRFASLLGLSESGVDQPVVIDVLLVPESAAAALGAPSWVAGYAHGDASQVVLFPGRVPVYPYRSLEELLGHEVAHVLIHRVSKGRPLPRWFHEGLSRLAEEAWGLEDRSRVALAGLRQARYELSSLDRRFADPGEVHRAYALAGAFVRDLVNRHGHNLPSGILARVASGAPFELAFEEAAGETLAQAEASFWRRFTFWYRWFPFLTSSTALWIGIVVLALAAGRRRRARARALEEKWELEEAWELEARRRLEQVDAPDEELVN